MQHSAFTPQALVCDLGAGRAAITDHLLQAGAQVIAVEKHPGRADYLRRRFLGQPVTVVQCDLLDWHPPRRAFHVVANPPFALTTAIIRAVTVPGSRLVRADLVVQRAAARHWATKQVTGRFSFRVDTLVPRSAFTPRPTVDAAILTITGHGR